MTYEEAAKLVPGQEVEARTGKFWGPAVVARSYWADGPPSLWVRHGTGFFPGMRMRPKVKRWPHDVRLRGSADPLSASVYADWLEENGEPEAAAKLRNAFPLACEEG